MDDNALKSMGDSAIGIRTIFHYGWEHKSPMNEAFVKAFRDEYKRNPDVFSIGGWDGMHLIYETLKKTGGKADGDSLIAAAKGMSWESPRGPISIDPNTRDIVQNVYIRRVEKVGDASPECGIRQDRERQGPGKVASKLCREVSRHQAADPSRAWATGLIVHQRRVAR
jgi:branched-chain amino acid transport system substrate-binding protein